MAKWCVIVPVKRLDRAKSRLDPHQIDPPTASGLMVGRASLALAFACDTVTAALAATSVDHVVVVTDDPLASLTLEAMGAVIVPDSPDAGINPALVHGGDVAMERWPGSNLAAMSSDLPCARPDDLDVALNSSTNSGHAHFVADSSGIGTTLYAAAAGEPFTPAFGTRSRAAHRRAGAVELTDAALYRLRRDVDTAIDLWDARRIGVGPNTAALLGRP